MAEEKAPARVRFSIDDDIYVLSEVYATNPFQDSRRWTSIAERVSEAIGRNFSTRAIRDRVDLLLAQFNTKHRFPGDFW